MSVTAIDHVAIPILNIDLMLRFYESLGFLINRSLAPRLYSVELQDQKINFHDPSLWQNSRFMLRGPAAKPGCGDFCFVWHDSEDALTSLLQKHEIEIIEGPVDREGGTGAIGTSVYVRDPDQNLVEFINYLA